MLKCNFNISDSFTSKRLGHKKKYYVHIETSNLDLTWMILSPSLILPSFAAMLFGSIYNKQRVKLVFYQFIFGMHVHF